MIIAFLFHAFLLSFANSDTIDVSQIEARTPFVSAASTEMQFVKGYDETTAMSFFHALPVVGSNESGFGPTRIDNNSLGIITTADSVLVVDKKTWAVLFDKFSNEVRPIASITKLMTALTLLDHGLNFDHEITISKADYRSGGRINVFTGEIFTIQDVWMDELIASDNVAATALVRSTGMSEEEFVKKMNKLALKLGMNNSHFVEVTGINANNVSTAQDVAKLINAALDKKMISDAVRRPVYSFKPVNKDALRTIYSTNILLNTYVNEDPYSVVGGKTGFTFEAGYCMAVEVDGPKENDEIIVVVLGADSPEDRFQEIKGLTDWTYENYNWNN